MPYKTPHEKTYVRLDLMKRVRAMADKKQSTGPKQLNYLLEKALAEEDKHDIKG